MIISHEIIGPSRCGGVINVSTITPKYYAGIQNACLQWCGEVGVLSKIFESFLLSQKFYFQKYANNTYFKNSTKKLFEKFSNKS